MNSVDLATVKELLGHKTRIMTLRYSHLSQGHKKKAVETVGVLINGQQSRFFSFFRKLENDASR
jgi:hypothetical protein